MPKPSDLKRLPLKAMIYGPPGSGKTALLYTLGAKLQVMDIDRGWLTAVTLKDKWTEARGQVDIIECHEDTTAAGSALDKVKRHLGLVQQQIAAGKYTSKVIALDSLTALAESALRRQTGETVGKFPAILAQIDQGKWGKAIRELQDIMAVLRYLPVHGIVLGHEMVKTVDNIDRIKVNVYGKRFPDDLLIYFDEIWYTKKNQIANIEEYVLQTMTSAQVTARSRAQLPNNSKQDEGMEPLLNKIGYNVN